MKPAQLSPSTALGAWSGLPQVLSADGSTLVPRRHEEGLINQTFMVGQPPKSVLQWVNPIFDPSVQLDIQALTERLASRGWTTPRLLETDDHQLWLPDGDGFWRLMTFVPGRTTSRLKSPALAASAGRLVGRFHAEMITWSPTFVSQGRRLPDTTERMDDLREITIPTDHQFADPLSRVRDALLTAWEAWVDDHGLDPNLPERPCHGDLKISNLRFDQAGQGVCLIDLDTLAYRPLAREMGDAWRSWCNPSGEDAPESCRLDLDLFGASARGWLEETAHLGLGDDEIASLVPGLERIALELAARFACDVIEPVYFREDLKFFDHPGGHNLKRARCQLQLARSARQQRAPCQELVEQLCGEFS